MTSPISLLAPLGAPAPSAPAPSEDPGAFAQLLAVALVSGLPLAAPAPVPAPVGADVAEGEILDDVAREDSVPGTDGGPPADGTTEVGSGEILEEGCAGTPVADMELATEPAAAPAQAGRAPRTARALRSPVASLAGAPKADVGPVPATETQVVGARAARETEPVSPRTAGTPEPGRARPTPGIGASMDASPVTVKVAPDEPAPSTPARPDMPAPAPGADRFAREVEPAETGPVPTAGPVLPMAADLQVPRPQLRDTLAVPAAAVREPGRVPAPSAGGVAEAVRAVVDAMRAMSRPAGEQVAATVAALRAVEAAAAQALRPLPGADGKLPSPPASAADAPTGQAAAPVVPSPDPRGADTGQAAAAPAAVMAPDAGARQPAPPTRSERPREGARRPRAAETTAVEPTVPASPSQAVAAMVLTALRAAMHPAVGTPGGDALEDGAPRAPLRAPVAEAPSTTPLAMPSSTAAEGALSPVALAEGIAEATGSAYVTDLRVVRGRAGAPGRTSRPAAGATPAAVAGPLPAKVALHPATPSMVTTDEPSTASTPREAARSRMPREAVSGRTAEGLVIPRPARADEPAVAAGARAADPVTPVVATAPEARVARPVPVRHAPPASHPAVAAGPEAGPEVPEARQELPLRDMEPAERRDATVTELAPGGDRATAAPASLSPATPGRGERATATAAGREARDVPYTSPPKEQAAGSADRVTLAVTDDAGRQTRIRVAVLGEQVRATIVPPDGDTAQQLERRMDDLTAALVRQGYSDPKVTVQVAGDTGPAWGGAAGAAATDTTAARGTDQSAGQERQGGGRREPDRQAGQDQRQSHQRGRQRDPEDRRR